jgi:hypothetical protein
MDTTGPAHACIVSAAGDLLAVGAQGTVDTAQDAADLQLMAAAPELLAALIDLLARANALDQSATHDGLTNCSALAKARAAIAKAGGAQ